MPLNMRTIYLDSSNTGIAGSYIDQNKNVVRSPVYVEALR
jgi:hypothetical protein